MVLDRRESNVMELIEAYAQGFITGEECVVMGDLVLNEISTISSEVDLFDLVFDNN